MAASAVSDVCTV